MRVERNRRWKGTEGGKEQKVERNRRWKGTRSFEWNRGRWKRTRSLEMNRGGWKEREEGGTEQRRVQRKKGDWKGTEEGGRIKAVTEKELTRVIGVTEKDERNRGLGNDPFNEKRKDIQ
jgi:hypothetical protein